MAKHMHYYWNGYCIHCDKQINKGMSVDGTKARGW
jgi:hypothetical protein